MYVCMYGCAGGIKPNVSTMGADQFDERYAQDRKEKGSFFNWYSLYIHTYIHIYIHIYAYTDTFKSFYTNPYIHTYIQKKLHS